VLYRETAKAFTRIYERKPIQVKLFLKKTAISFSMAVKVNSMDSW